MQQMSTSQPQRPSGGRLQPLHGGQNAADGRSAPCRPPWQLIAAQLQGSHTAAGAAHHVSSLAADLSVPRPDGRRPKGLAPRGGSRARHTTAKRCASAFRTRPIARFPAQSAPSCARLTACTAAFLPWQANWRARTPARRPQLPGPVPGRGAARISRPRRRAGWR